MTEWTIARAAFEVLRDAGKPLTVAEITSAILRRELYTFQTDDKEGMVRRAIRRRCFDVDRSDAVEPKCFENLIDGRYQISESSVEFIEAKNFNLTGLANKFSEWENETEIYKEEKAPFNPESVRVTPKPMPIDSVLRRINRDEVNLAPGFQREAGIWNEVAQSRLIESIILRIPLPAFYIDATDEDKWSVVDGLQRLTTFKKFILDESLRLEGLEYFENLEGKLFSELPRRYQRRIEEATLNLYLIEKGSPPEVTFNIFKRVNTGGLPLSPQELRHALNYGKATDFLEELSSRAHFKELVKIPKSKIKRMDDKEYILGYVAFKLTDYREYPNKKGRDAFLNEAMKQLNSGHPESFYKEISDGFDLAMLTSKAIFGDVAFRKISMEKPKKYPVNKALFEVWSVSLSKLEGKDIALLLERKTMLLDGLAELIDYDADFLKSISQAANKISIRFSRVEELIQKVLEA